MTTLSEVCELIVDSEHKTAPKASDGYPMVRTTDIELGKLNLRAALRVDETAYREWTVRAVPQPDDLILAREAPVGNVGIVPPGAQPCLGQRTVLLRPDRGRVEPRYLNYLLSGPELRGRMEALSNGATVPHLNMRDIRLLELPPLPRLPEQCRIASILAAYDDLVENNTRRIQILEEMAQAIYREWFVEFRFPGHEGARMVDSELGPIPDRWRVSPASEAIEIDPKLRPDPTSIRPFVPMTSVTETTMHIEPIEHRKGVAGSKFQNGDTLFARITPCLENGKTAYVQALEPGEIGSGSTEFIVLRSRLLTPEAVYLLARSDPFRAHAIKSMSGATGRQRVRSNCFDSYLMPVPPESLLSAFEAVVEPMFRLSHALSNTNRNLRATRDLLLPRLISGEIDVSNLDIGDAEPAA